MVRVGVAVVLAAIGLAVALVVVPLASAKDIRDALTAPGGGNPFGGAAVGAYRIHVQGESVRIRASVDLAPSADQVFEGWLVDMQTGYKLSLGLLRGNDLDFRGRFVNPWTYGVLVITEEPQGDLDPNPAAPVAGALLPAPFGQ